MAGAYFVRVCRRREKAAKPGPYEAQAIMPGSSVTFFSNSESTMIVQARRTVQATMLSLVLCTLVTMLGCSNRSGQVQTDSEEPSFEGKALSAWIAQLQDKDRPVGGGRENKGTRCEAAEILGKFDLRNAEQHREKALAALGKAFRDRNDTLRFVAANSLQRYGQHAVPVFLDALKIPSRESASRLPRCFATLKKVTRSAWPACWNWSSVATQKFGKGRLGC
jgi:hypothetical protein